MLCLVVSEVVGRLSSDPTSDPTLDNDEAKLDLLGKVAEQTCDLRYRQSGNALIFSFAMGSYSLLPKQPTHVKARVEWAQQAGDNAGLCIDFLASPRGTGR